MEKSSIEEPNKSFEIMTIGADDTVALFSRLQREQGNLSYAVVHILKFDDGEIVEVWDIGKKSRKTRRMRSACSSK